MAEKKTVNIERTKLVELLTAKRDQMAEERQAELSKQNERNQAAADRIIAALSDTPQLLIAVVAYLRGEFDLDATEESFGDKVADTFPELKESAQERTIEKLIRVYEVASDETIEVGVGDEAYAYI